MSKVLKTESCWLWTGRKQGRYGSVNINKTRQRAHRVSWTIHNGAIPAGMMVCHRCDVRLCVSPAHLFLGTQADNLRDMAAKGRSCRGETNAQSKMTEATVIELRRARASGATLAAVAKAAGVSIPTAVSALTGKTWRHVGAEVSHAL